MTDLTLRTMGCAALFATATIATPVHAQEQASANAARPLGSPSDWLDPQDYPAQALREEAEGTTGVRLDIAADGTVRKCTVTRSSGFAVLDDTACLRLEQRAMFEPARNDAGERVPGNWSTSVVWRMPDMQRYPLPEPAHVEFVIEVDEAGNTMSCEIIAFEAPGMGPDRPCLDNQIYFPVEDENGNPVARRIRFRMQVIHEEIE